MKWMDASLERELSGDVFAIFSPEHKMRIVEHCSP
jgi:hypothetical protein